MLSKWQSLPQSNLFAYIVKLFEKGESNDDSFVLLANIVKTMTQFDPQFEVKMVTHFCVGANKTPGNRHQYQQALLQYANLFDPTIKDQKAANTAKQINYLPLRRFINDNIVSQLI